MTKTELSLLLYLETCAVDLGGRVDARRMNEADFEIAKRWHGEGFIEFGRIVLQDHNSQGGNWVGLSEAAWTAAHAERRARAARLLIQRRYRKASEAKSSVKEPA